MATDAPRAAELATTPAVVAALDSAWIDSLLTDPDRRHEEGGWIYLDPTTAEVRVIRASAGTGASIRLADPPLIDGAFVVGKFHTHPNPTADGWRGGPSGQDRRVDDAHGVPDLIRADDGLYFSGPDRRRGGLTGPNGYPC